MANLKISELDAGTTPLAGDELVALVQEGTTVRVPSSALKGLQGDPGDDGREVELQKGTTHIQWRYVGDPTWTDLVALEDITGPPGTGGAPQWEDIEGKPDLVLGDDSRLTDSRTPTGGAGGVLSGTFPNPGFAVDMATQGELDTQTTLLYTALDDLDAAKIDLTEMGAANGVATLGADSKILVAQLPAIAITDTFAVASEAAMLALTAEKGDIAVRSDINKTFALAADPATTLGNWLELKTPTDVVLSVAGRTGAVTLTKTDVGLGNVDNTADSAKPVSTAQQTALDAKQATLVSGTNIRTVNGESLLGSENLVISGGGGGITRETRTSNTALVQADNQKLIVVTGGTFTQTFGTRSAGWNCTYHNAGTGDITITTDGVTYKMYQNEKRLLVYDGTDTHSIVLNAYSKVFSASDTWVKAPGYAGIEGEVKGDGGSGRRGATGSARSGGSGGACAPFSFRDSQLSSTEAVVVGTGGAAVATDNTDGADGSGSGFKNVITGGGKGGTASATTGGFAYGQDGTNQSTSGANQTSDTTYGGAGAKINVSSAYYNTIWGGGAGDSITSANARITSGTTVFGGPGGTTNSAGTTPTAGAGPGGGGGASTNGTPSGAGGPGAVHVRGVI